MLSSFVLLAASPIAPIAPDTAVIAVAKDVEAVRAHYNARRDGVLAPRRDSRVLGLRKLNNWVKAAAFTHYTPVLGGYHVADLACGKGADMGKWGRLGVQTYLGIDIADGSLADARSRAAALRRTDAAVEAEAMPMVAAGEAHWRPPPAVVPPHTHFLHADMTATDVPALLAEYRASGPTKVHVPATYAVVSCQYALHYGFRSVDAATRTLTNMARLMDVSGTAIVIVPDADELMRRFHGAAVATGAMRAELAPFTIATPTGEPMCTVTPEAGLAAKLARGEQAGLRYTFWLADCIDACDEFLVCPLALAAVAAAAGLRVQESANVATFATARGVGAAHYSKIEADAWASVYKPLWAAMGLDATPPSLSDWAVASLYRVILLERVDKPVFSVPSMHARAPPTMCACHAGPAEWERRWDAAAPTTAVTDGAVAGLATASGVVAGSKDPRAHGGAVSEAARVHALAPAPPPTYVPTPHTAGLYPGSRRPYSSTAVPAPASLPVHVSAPALALAPAPGHAFAHGWGTYARAPMTMPPLPPLPPPLPPLPPPPPPPMPPAPALYDPYNPYDPYAAATEYDPMSPAL